jgi:hypothetical protein
MENNLIAIKKVCLHYEIEVSFIFELHQHGLIELLKVEQEDFIHEDHVNNLEKMIRLKQELNVNPEGIDVIFNLLEKERELRAELLELKNKLSRFSDY